MQVFWKHKCFVNIGKSIDSQGQPIRGLVSNWLMFPRHLCFQNTCTWSVPRIEANFSNDIGSFLLFGLAKSDTPCWQVALATFFSSFRTTKLPIYINQCEKKSDEIFWFNHMITYIFSPITYFSHILMRLMQKWKILIKSSEFLMISFETI